MSKILIVATSHVTMPGSDDATGAWYEEVAAPYWVFRDAGHEVTLATIRGGEVPFDPRSLTESPLPEAVRRFHDDEEAVAAARGSRVLNDLAIDGLDAIFLAGGHGTMWDFPHNPALGAALASMFEKGKVVAAVCHGPAGFVGAKTRDGGALVAGRRITCFADAEERAVGLQDRVPFLLETTLRELGATVTTGEDFAPHVVEDDTLLTGQNPKSSKPLADRVVAVLDAKARHAA